MIRAAATDRHSGVGSGTIAYRPLAGGTWRELPTALAGGELRARVDSLSEPAGRYVFRAVATDRAGNEAASASRRDGTAMIVDFPLREPTRVSSSIGGRQRAEAGYGRRPALAAVLRGPDGPIAGQEVELLERFAPGSSLDPVGRTVRTDRNGRISVRLSRGPSRTVRVGFAGTRRYQPAAGGDLALAVRGSASMNDLPRRVRAGRRVAFHGSIGTYGAAIPKGKLVELQVKGGGVPPLSDRRAGVPDRFPRRLATAVSLRSLLRSPDPLPVPAQGLARAELSLSHSGDARGRGALTVLPRR